MATKPTIVEMPAEKDETPAPVDPGVRPADPLAPVTDKYHGQGGCYYINEHGVRVPVTDK